MPGLVGRTAERAVLDRLLSPDTDDVRALVLRGDAGVGKSALLQFAAEEARARRALIFRSVGVETESAIEFSALHQLVQPIMRAVRDYPDEWKRTLERTFGPAGDEPVSAFELSNALLGLLDVATKQSTVLLIVDDVQWIDEASASMLAFVARRIANPAVCVLIAFRSGVESPLERAGLPELLIAPLSDEDSLELLEQTAGTLGFAARRQLLTESAGNPLALLELPKALTPGQRTGGDSLIENLTLSQRLETVFTARFDELADGARWLLLLCALDRTGRMDTIKQAAGEDWWFPDLVAANTAGIIRLDGDQITFRHPLARSAIAQGANPADRKRAHSRLSVALSAAPDAWAWHRAAAADGPDAEVADALSALARRAFDNGDSRGGLRGILKAIELTPEGPVRDIRSARAAFLANVTGQTDVARRILPSRRRGHRFAPTNGRLDETDGYIAASMGFWLVTQDADMDGAATFLLTALRGTRNVTDAWVLELFDLLVLLCLRTGRADYWAGLNALLDELGDDVPEAIALTRDGLGDPARTAHGFAGRIADFRERASGAEPWQLMWMAACSVYVDDLPAWRGQIRRVIQEEELGGSLASFMTALVLSSLDGLAAGEWSTAKAEAERGLETAERLGFAANVGDYRSILATISARQGDYPSARTQIGLVQGWALPHGFRHNRDWALFGSAQIEMAQQNYDEAYGLLIGISPAGELAPYQPVALMAFLDTVAAAWKSARPDQARSHVAAGHDADLGTVSPRLAFHLAASDAIVSPPPGKAALFDKALASPGISQWPFDEARIRLHYGSWLRTEGDVLSARPQLQAASRIFDRLGANPWRERAKEELEKSADRGDRIVSGAFALLTPQETRIAVLASEGRSNNDIAALLFLSPRTVASHLYKIFPKLGVTSRAGLHLKLDSDAGQR